MARKPLTKIALKEIRKKSADRAAAPKMELEDIKNLEEPIYVEKEVKEKKTGGRPKNTDYLSYEEAREFVRGEMIPSRSKYLEWWERNKPKSIPRFPYRVYKEWTSWNDYLGNDNEFSAKTSRAWRPFDDAVQFVQKLKIESYPKWMEYCREHRAEMPEDIPSRPDLVYPQWRTWPYWLGNKPIEIVNAAVEARKNHIFFVIHDQDVPENVFTFGVEQGGQTALKDRWEREKFDIVRLFWFEQEQADHIKRIIDSLSTPYMDNERQRICQNVWEINYYLEVTLQRIIRF